MKQKSLSEPETLREEFIEDKPEIKVLEEYSKLSNQYKEVKVQEGKENVVILKDFLLDKENQILEQIDEKSEDYQKFYEWTYVNHMAIIGKIEKEGMISHHFSTYQQRNQIIHQIYQKVIQKQYQGICIEFESIDEWNCFNRFIIELVPKFKEAGLKVIVKAKEQMDLEKIKNKVDFIIK